MEELEPREGVNWQEHFPQLTEQGVQTSSSRSLSDLETSVPSAGADLLGKMLLFHPEQRISVFALSSWGPFTSHTARDTSGW